MRLATLLFAVLAVPTLFAPSSALAYEMPYDPYPWCAVYSGDGGGGTNCGFLTIQQCRDDGERYRRLLRTQSVLQPAVGGTLAKTRSALTVRLTRF